MDTNAYSGRIAEARKIAESLASGGVSAKRVSVCGRNVIVTVRSRETADKAAQLIAAAFQLVGIRESRDYAVQNTNTVLKPTTLPVWLVMARA